MLTIELNNNEHDYLCSASFLTDGLRKVLFSGESSDNIYLLKISEDQAEAFRDLCGEQLQRVGFDDKYKPTLEGKILESLIDKFFIG